MHVGRIRARTGVSHHSLQNLNEICSCGFVWLSEPVDGAGEDISTMLARIEIRRCCHWSGAQSSFGALRVIERVCP